MTRRALLVGAALLSFTGISQGQTVSAGKPTRGTFAPPWGVTFQHIQDAMLGKFGAYSCEQLRNEFTRTGCVGTLEHLLYRPADATKNRGERFKLQFLGIKGRKLTAIEFRRESTLFNGKSGFTFRYKGFHVADAALAAKSYNLVFLASAKRAMKNGNVDVYRMAVIPKAWDRTAWLLELDTRTGYPLYAAEYSIGAGYKITLQSQVIVSKFLVGVRPPNNTVWWSPIKGIVPTATVQEALKKALTQSKVYVAPRISELPGGFQLAGSEVHIDPYRGERLAVLRYTDGVDHVFVTERNVLKTARGAEDTIAFLNVDGVTRCSFTHRGVNFDVIGRKRPSVRRLSVDIYRRAIVVLK